MDNLATAGALLGVVVRMVVVMVMAGAGLPRAAIISTRNRPTRVVGTERRLRSRNSSLVAGLRRARPTPNRRAAELVEVTGIPSPEQQT